MTLAAHSTYPIFCASPILLHLPNAKPTRLHSSAPIYITAENPVYIVPTTPPGPTFAAGWDKLSDELKVMILQNNLVLDHSIRGDAWNEDVAHALFPYLRMTPEIAGLAKEIFYSKNTFEILLFFLRSPHRDEEWVLKAPSSPFREIIRRIELMTEFWPAPFCIFPHLADYQSAFPALQHIHIICRVTHALNDRAFGQLLYDFSLATGKVKLPKMEFAHPGQLDVVSGPNISPANRKRALEILKQKITFAAKVVGN